LPARPWASGGPWRLRALAGAVAGRPVQVKAGGGRWLRRLLGAHPR